MRRDFGDIVDMYFEAGHLLGIPTNATHGLQHARHMAGKVAYVNVGLEGPRATTNRVRGDYDKVMAVNPHQPWLLEARLRGNVLASFGLLAAAIVLVGGKAGIFTATYKINIYFPSANGLRSSDEVWRRKIGAIR